eukprot:5338504-Pleurochrysis_carterae.AAC.1
MDADAVATEPFPGDLRTPQPAPHPGRKPGGRARRKPLPRRKASGDGARTDGVGGAGGAPMSGAAGGGMPESDIAIEDLFAPGIYAERVQTWFAAADAA